MDLKPEPLPSEFRVWVNNCYVRNREERLTYQQEPYKMCEYVSKFKWWLRSQYQEQQKKEHNGRRF
jgi:hypothetical protein